MDLPTERTRAILILASYAIAERAKYEIHNAVKSALRMADSWDEFKSELAKRGVHLEFVYKDKERTKVQGIRFM